MKINTLTTNEGLDKTKIIKDEFSKDADFSPHMYAKS